MSVRNQVLAPVLLPGEDDWVLIGNPEKGPEQPIAEKKPAATDVQPPQCHDTQDPASLKRACADYVSTVAALISQRKQIQAQALASRQQAERMKDASERLTKVVEDSRARSMAVHSSSAAAEARLLQQHESLTAARDQALRAREAALKQYDAATASLRNHRQQRERAQRDQQAGLEACDKLVKDMEPRVDELTAQFQKLQEQLRSSE